MQEGGQMPGGNSQAQQQQFRVAQLSAACGEYANGDAPMGIPYGQPVIQRVPGSSLDDAEYDPFAMPAGHHGPHIDIEKL